MASCKIPLNAIAPVNDDNNDDYDYDDHDDQDDHDGSCDDQNDEAV